MKLEARIFPVLICAMALLTIAGCGGTQQGTAPSGPASTSTPTKTAANVNKNATMTADPNPIKVCDGTGLGITKINYNAEGPTAVEVRVSSPDGGLLAHTGPASTATTGKWVSNGTIFYLQDVTGGKPLTAENTVATLTVNVTTEGCE